VAVTAVTSLQRGERAVAPAASWDKDLFVNSMESLQQQQHKNKIIIIIIIYVVLSSWLRASARVHSVHLLNAD